MDAIGNLANSLALALGLAGPQQLLVLGLIFLAVLVGGLAVAGAVGGRGGLRRRLDPVAAEAGRSAPSASRPGTIRYSEGGSLWARLTQSIGGRMAGAQEDDTGKASTLRQRLIQAGYFSPSAVSTYYALRLMLGIALPLLFLVTSPVVAGSMRANQLMLLALGLGVFGAYGPTIWLVLRTRRRQRLVREGFPDALDMLLVCVEAGMALDAAVDRVSNEIQRAHPALGIHLALLSAELRAGRRREDALRNLSDRIGIEEVSSLVTLLLQSERLGVSLAQTLRVHADEMRTKRMLKAEEKAGKLPVLLSVPLVLFILPALMTVVLTPAIIRVVRELLPALKGGG